VVKRSCVFLDRDGVINAKAAPGEYIRTWEEFRFLPRIADWIRAFNDLGVLVIVVTNQRGVALGRMKAEDVSEIHRKMVEELARAGARVDDVFCCPHHENSCGCRKPRPGLVLAAKKKWNLDLRRSILIGDSECDRELAERCGMAFLRVADGQIEEVEAPPANGFLPMGRAVEKTSCP
jgi:D-glycero-D-manno-heptose 1,7-bisphosphate phosphatase